MLLYFCLSSLRSDLAAIEIFRAVMSEKRRQQLVGINKKGSTTELTTTRRAAFAVS